jgi:2-polyprenyl-6-methoxyphenol hydroxylase-like FAD-dependent oxidoreductase
MLLEKLKPNTLVWGKRLRDYIENQDGVKLLWEDGTFEDELFDIVVGADGIRSNVRLIRD